MTDKVLKGCILEALDNQLRLNEPVFIRETLKRLIESGNSEKQAKEKMAAILLEEIYNVLSSREGYNDDRYRKGLEGLR